MANIAIVTSTAFGGSNKECFKAGLTSSLAGKPEPTILSPLFESFGNYDAAALRKLVRSAAENDPRPDLIVAVGGLEMAQAAATELQRQDPKFVFLSNDTLEGNPVALAGGVNLNAPGSDDARKMLLKNVDENVQESSLYLIVNSNSPTWRNDAKNWPASRVVRFFEGIANPLKYAGRHFIAEFEKLAKMDDPKPTGLVISADPFFYYWRTSFTKAMAEKLPLPVCYPFKEFYDVAVGDKSKIAYLDKPPLNNSSNNNDETTAYFQLGKQVGKFIAGMPDVGIVRWIDSTWELQLDGPEPQTSGIEIEIRLKGCVDQATLQKLIAALQRPAK